MNLTNHPIISGSKATIDTMRSIFISSDIIDTIWYIWVVSPCILWTQFQLQDGPSWDWELSSPIYTSHTMLNLFTTKLLPVILLGEIFRPRKQIDLFFGKVKVMWYQSQWWLWIRTKSHTLLLLDRITALTQNSSSIKNQWLCSSPMHSTFIIYYYNNYNYYNVLQKPSIQA